MMKSKAFWIGAGLAYALAIVLPPTKLLSLGRKSG
jgi:hypothetical protein